MRRRGAAPIARDEVGVDPLQVGLWQVAQELPGEVKGFLDASPFPALMDKAVLELVREDEGSGGDALTGPLRR
jgi:hypothetical protein